MRVSHYRFGEQKGGYIRTIRAGGFSGIAGTIWDVVYQKKIKDKLNDGKQLEDMLVSSLRIVGKVIGHVVLGNDKHFYIGRMIQETCNL